MSRKIKCGVCRTSKTLDHFVSNRTGEQTSTCQTCRNKQLAYHKKYEAKRKANKTQIKRKPASIDTLSLDALLSSKLVNG